MTLRKVLLGVLTLVILTSVLLVGCNQPTPPASKAPTSAAPTSAAPTTAKPAGAEFTYQVGTFYDDGSAYTTMLKKWTVMVNQLTNGRVKMDVVSGEALVKAQQTLEALSTGLVKVAFMNSAYHTGQLSIFTVLTSPFSLRNTYLSVPIAEEMRPIIQKYLDKYNVRDMWGVNFGQYMIWTKTPITKYEDLKGKIMRSPGGAILELVKAFGGSPVSMTLPDTYTALQRGTVDGGTSGEDSYLSFKLNEVAPYATIMNDRCLPSIGFGPTWNTQDFNKLPKDIQDQILEASKLAALWSADYMFNLEVSNRAKMASLGAKVSYLAPEEQARWQKVGEPIWDWAAQQAIKGGATKADVDAIIAIMKKYLNS